MFRFRFFSKKRGGRRTMSDVGGRIARGLFFAALTVGGGAMLAAVLGSMTIQEWRANHEFVETRATIISERVARVDHEGRPKYRPEFIIRYTAAGVQHQVAGV